MGKIFCCENREGIALVRFDVPGQEVNTWTPEALDDLDQVLDYLELKQKELDAAVFISGKEGFHAGGDLKMLEQVSDPETLRERCEHLHELFCRMEKLTLPTVAAIRGQCLGGGLEFALAMSARIAIDGPRTTLGLPECTVGLIPGGGGTQRLPLLVGLDALDLIWSGTVLDAERAAQAGIVDRVVSAGADLEAEALIFADECARGIAERARPELDLAGLPAAVKATRQKVRKVYRGRDIPAPMLALDAVEQGLVLPLREALTLETELFLRALATPESKGTINTFFLKTITDKPLNLVPEDFVARPMNRVAVLGFGTMGRGIVIDLLRRVRCPVVIKDVPEAIAPGMAFVRHTLQGMAEKGRLRDTVDELMALVTPVSEWTDDIRPADLVIEAVLEDPDLKHRVYAELCDVVGDECIIASNTSSLPVQTLAAGVKNPARFAGAHFFSPVWKMQLMEIIRGSETADGTVNQLLTLAAALKKRPVVCNDNPGFVVNAMLFPYFLKSYELMEQGVPIEEIDAAMTSFGLPVGPVRLTDDVGIDTSYFVLTRSLGMTPPPALENVFRDGRFGRHKNGRGFYTADGKVDPTVIPLVNPAGNRASRSRAEIQEQLFLPFVETGKRLLDSAVVEDPRLIDIGAIWGVGFPADKGGPMKWADLQGLSERLFAQNFYG